MSGSRSINGQKGSRRPCSVLTKRPVETHLERYQTNWDTLGFFALIELMVPSVLNHGCINPTRFKAEPRTYASLLLVW